MKKSLFIVGPTASGKSSLALALASLLDAEIASLDAFQIYRQLDIGTGKPTQAERASIRHHLIDIADPTQDFSVAEFLQHARQVYDDAERRGKTLIWVGGTGLYVRALCQGLTDAPPSDEEVVRELEKKTVTELADEISKIDPVWSAKADLKNPRRTIRALAVFKQTGKRMSDWQAESTKALVPDSTTIFLQPDIDELREVIRLRVKKMWDNGWPAEVAKLREIDGWEISQSAAAIGYLDIGNYLDAEWSMEECLDAITLETGQYAKRQLTWFNSQDNTFSIKIKAKDGHYSTHELLPKLQEVLSPFNSSQ